MRSRPFRRRMTLRYRIKCNKPKTDQHEEGHHWRGRGLPYFKAGNKASPCLFLYFLPRLRWHRNPLLVNCWPYDDQGQGPKSCRGTRLAAIFGDGWAEAVRTQAHQHSSSSSSSFHDLSVSPDVGVDVIRTHAHVCTHIHEQARTHKHRHRQTQTQTQTQTHRHLCEYEGARRVYWG